MTLNDLGKRFERLLVLALPISLLCVVTSFFQVVHFEYTRNSERIVLSKFESTVSGLRGDLDRFFLDSKKPPTTPSYLRHHAILDWKDPSQYDFVQNYKDALSAIVAASEKHHGSDAKRWLSAFVRAELSPDQMIAAVNVRLKIIENTVEFGELVLPVRPNVSIMGMNVAIPLHAIGTVGYFTSCLALILWYGSMRLTRRREMLAAILNQFRNQLFPHLLNSTMTILASDARAARGRMAKINITVQKVVLVLLRTMIFGLIAGLTILPLAYTAIIVPFDFNQIKPPSGLLVSYWLYCLVGCVPILQLLLFWLEELYWLALAPIRIVVLGRDVLVR